MSLRAQELHRLYIIHHFMINAFELIVRYSYSESDITRQNESESNIAAVSVSAFNINQIDQGWLPLEVELRFISVFKSSISPI